MKFFFIWLLYARFQLIDKTMRGENKLILFDILNVFLFYRYRNFPKVKSAFIPTSIQRKHMCNYMGTIYVNSSRQVLLDLLSFPQMKDKCYVKVRHE